MSGGRAWICAPARYLTLVAKHHRRRDMRKIKVLAINTSPRKGRNTEKLLDEVLAGCRSVGAADSGAAGGEARSEEEIKVEVKMIGVADAAPEDILFCRGCWACAKTGRCACGDDFIKRLYDDMAAADVVIFGVPVYFYSVPAQCKVIMDRALAYMPAGSGKVVATALTCGSAGVLSALQTMESFYSANDFLDAGWVATYGKTDDKEKGKKVAYGLGRKAVRLAAIVGKAEDEAGAEGDDELLEDLRHTNHFAYGTHTF